MKRIFPMLVCVLMLLQSLFLFAPAASAAGADAMDASYVVDDLNKMGVDITKYKADAENDRMELLSFTEFGYKVNGDFSEYGLYLYLWNPSGVKLEDSDLNSIQLSYGLNAGGKSGYRKYGLEILSWSTGSGYEYVFYKVKIKDSRYIAQSLNKAMRTYEFSGVEILRKGNSNATDYKLGGAFTFTGYHEGCNTSGFSTLWVDAVKFEVADLELHPVSYFADDTNVLSSSDLQSKGSEIFGVYFSVPKWVIEKYGNVNDDRLRGLVSVAGDYNEVHINGILTDSNAVRNAATDHDNFYFLSRYYQDSMLGDSTRIVHCAYHYPEYLNPRLFEPAADHWVAAFSDFIISEAKTVDGIGAQDFLTAYHNSGIDWRGKLHKKYNVTETDKATITQGIMLGDWFKNLFTGKGGSTSQTQTFDLLTRLSPLTVGSLSDKAISETYLVNEAEADALQKFTTSKGAKGETVYLMRFAVRDYEVDKLTEAGIKSDGKYNKVDIGNSYYFEKTVFEDFDILELTFRDEENKKSVVPVSASPIDVTGGIPSPGTDNPNEKPKADNPTDWWTLFNSLETWIKVVAVVAVFVLLFLAFRFFGGFFGFVGRIVTAPFRLLGKGISSGVRAGQSLHEGRLERKAQKEHDEDRAEAKIDRDRRRKREDRADELTEKKTESKFGSKPESETKTEKEKKS